MNTKTILSVVVLCGIFILPRTEIMAQAAEVIEVQPFEERIDNPSTGWNDFIYQQVLPGSRENNSRLTLSKRFNSENASNEGSFSVENTATRLSLSIDGAVETGSISVTVMLPGGEPFKSITIDNAADVRWSGNINIDEKAKDRYYGKWTYKIVADAAKGSYRLSINTY